jgi:hypothetical protein
MRLSSHRKDITYICFAILGFVPLLVLARPPVPVAFADIVYIGDSHSTGCFGSELDKSLRSLIDPVSQNHVRVQSAATCGSSSASWLAPGGNSTLCGFRACGPSSDGDCATRESGKSASIESLIRVTHPRVAVIELGSNMLKQNLESALQDATKLAQKVKDSGARCIWIGPPQPTIVSPQVYENFVKHLSDTVSENGCRFIDSNPKTARENLGSNSLGLHYDCDHATAWSKKVSAEMNPIVLDLLRGPSTSSGLVHGTEAH